jgi:hypothetical protein
MALLDMAVGGHVLRRWRVSFLWNLKVEKKAKIKAS